MISFMKLLERVVLYFDQMGNCSVSQLELASALLRGDSRFLAMRGRRRSPPREGALILGSTGIDSEAGLVKPAVRVYRGRLLLSEVPVELTCGQV